MKTSIKMLTLGALATVLALGAAGAADAKGRHFRGHHFHGHHFHGHKHFHGHFLRGHGYGYGYGFKCGFWKHGKWWPCKSFY